MLGTDCAPIVPVYHVGTCTQRPPSADGTAAVLMAGVPIRGSVDFDTLGFGGRELLLALLLLALLLLALLLPGWFLPAPSRRLAEPPTGLGACPVCRLACTTPSKTSERSSNQRL